MRSLAASIVSGLLISACAGPRAADGEGAAREAMGQVIRPEPHPEPVLLPPASPPTRLDSQIRAMSHAELAGWILPSPQARQVVRAELLRGRMPRLTGIALYRAPRPAGPAGLCEVQGWSIWLRVPNEDRLTYQQHLDPPLQPYQYTPFVRWKVIGSARKEARSGPPDCAAALPYGDWFEGPSAETVHRAAALVEEAQLRPKSVRITCSQMRYDEASQDFRYPACPIRRR